MSAILPLAENIARKVKQLTGSKDDAFRVKLCLEEALTNAMRHGNKLDRRLKVSVKITLTPSRIVIDIRDQGKGFDHARVPDPTAPERSAKPSGRGVFLMRKLMDSVRYFDKGRRVVLRASLKAAHA